MATRNRNRGGGGNQGGGDNKIAVIANISGKRSDCKITVIIRMGRFVVSGQAVMLRLGTADNPNGPWIMDPANPAQRLTLSTDTDGEVLSPGFDFAADDYKGFTQALVVYYRNTDPGRGIYEQAVQLPAFEATDGAKTPKKSFKRLQFAAPEGGLKSRTNRYSLPTIRTLNSSGRGSAENLVFTATSPVTLINKATGSPLDNGGYAVRVQYFEYTTPATGLCMLEATFEGLECELTVTHVESGEQASIKLAFEY